MIISQTKYYNAVAIACGGDYATLQQLWRNYRSWSAAWRRLTKALDPEIAWQKMQSQGINLVLRDDQNYPALLREIPLRPFGIYYKGSLPAGETPTVAIVGTRKASDQGQIIAERLATALTERRIVVISGLALGIDETAQKAVVKQSGITVAVMACGIDQIYPAQNEWLAEKIIAHGGAIVSEYPCGTPPYQSRFLERNRIISGLSLATIVVEAPRRSGALATAHFALDQNREVFVVPGSIMNKNYEGSHSLLKKGAALLTTIDDLFEQIPSLQFCAKPRLFLETTTDIEQKNIIDVLKQLGEPVLLDKLIEITKLTPHALNRSLALLVIEEKVSENNGRYYLT